MGGADQLVSTSRAALITLPYSNGPTEGVNTKTKRIARQMHGRAGFTLLRHRLLDDVVLASVGVHQGSTQQEDVRVEGCGRRRGGGRFRYSRRSTVAMGVGGLASIGSQVIRVTLEGSADSDQEELDACTLELRDRLLELDVEDVTLERSAAAPEGAKPGEVIAVGALAVTAVPLVLRSAVRLLETWITHRPVRTARVTIGEESLEVEAVSAADQRRVIDAFLARHGDAPQPAQVPGSGAAGEG